MHMNKKQLFHNSLLVLVGIICAVGLSYVHAATYSDPSGTPPAGNTEIPLSTGINDKIKTGGLSVNAFIANANAELDQATYFGGVLHADPANTNATIAFGGTDAANIVRKVALAITGGFSNTGTLASTPLSNTTTSAVCADQNGNVILCSVIDMCSNISGTQTTVPAGDVANSDGTCSVAPKRYYSQLSSNKSAQYFGGGVINSHLVYQTSHGSGMPWIATLGMDNDTPYGWVVDSIKTINSTSFTPNQGTIMNVTENGSYELKIASSGKVGIKGKFSADNNFIAADFYLKIHHASDGSDQWVRLANTSNPANSLT
ncbi:MAG: hypothetical protein JWM92_380, partial [Candidatus Nomurabacteria bacterium]|nr:hypothetical protein [Candidatus Nomurabacteria bacterium]